MRRVWDGFRERPWIVPALLGIGLALYQTRFGPGASGDSSSYLMGAENLLAGNGFSRYSGGYEVKPITGFPPFFSMALAAIGFSGLELMTASRLINAAAFGANIALAGSLVGAYTRSAWASLLAGGLILLADTLLELHTWVMSEPLYISLTLSAVWAFLRYLEKGRYRWLLAAGLLTAGSSITRLVGPALTMAGIGALIAFGLGGYKRRLGDALGFAMVSLAPLYLWLRRNAAVAGTLVNRDIAYHPMEPGLMRLFLAEISSWFVPHQVPLPTAARAVMAVVIAAGSLGGLLFLGVRHWFRREQTLLTLSGPTDARFPALPWVLSLYIGANLVILFINSTFLDASTTPAAPARYLAPVFAALVPIAVSSGLYLARRYGDSAARRVAFSAYAVLLIALYGINSWPMVRDPYPHLGYTGRRYLWSDVLATLQGVPDATPIVSNNPEMIYILLGRPAYVRPILFDQYRQAVREDYEEQFSVLSRQIQNGGIFVVFDQIEMDDQSFIDRMDLTLLESYSQVRIYRIPSSRSFMGAGSPNASAWELARARFVHVSTSV